jgi:hypothetical protein
METCMRRNMLRFFLIPLQGGFIVLVRCNRNKSITQLKRTRRAASQCHYNAAELQAAEALPLAADDRRGRTDVCGGSNTRLQSLVLNGFPIVQGKVTYPIRRKQSASTQLRKYCLSPGSLKHLATGLGGRGSILIGDGTCLFTIRPTPPLIPTQRYYKNKHCTRISFPGANTLQRKAHNCQ